jgi:YfiH family protein
MIDPSAEIRNKFHWVGALSYLTFGALDDLGVAHGAFSRQGGVSPAPWASLNMGATVGDSLENVRENRRRALAALQRDPSSSHDTWLVHGTAVVFAEAARPIDVPPQKADILLTDRPEITLMMRFADCTPILLYDPVRKVAGLAHAGWMGTVKLVAAAAVQAMEEHYGSKTGDIVAVIGPAICAEHYPVGLDVVEQVRRAFPSRSEEMFQIKGSQFYFDLWKANQAALESAGVEHIYQSGVCTACDTGHWYSHRAEAGQTGRFGALIAVP